MRLQVEELNKAVGATNVRNTLRDLPRSLDEFHDKALSRIKNFEKNSKRAAFHVLSWIFYAQRPLQMKELLAAVMLSQSGRKQNSSVQDEAHLPYNVNKLSEGLAFHDEHSGIVAFAHPTVQEYFKTLIDTTNDDSFTDQFLSKIDVAKVCLNCIGSVVFKECKPSSHYIGYNRYYRSLDALLKQNPFLPYSVQFWSLHAREADEPQAVQDAIFMVFASKTSRIGVHEAAEITRQGNRGSFWIPKNFTFLHFAAENGLTKITDILLKDG